MDESAWLNGTDPSRMLGFVQARGPTSERRCRLFACACVRQIWDLLPDAACRHLVEVAEKFAESAVGRDRLADALAAIPIRRRLRGYANRARSAAWLAGFDSDAASRFNSAYRSGHVAYDWGTAARAAVDAVDTVVLKAAKGAQQAGRWAAEAMRAARKTADIVQAGLLREIFGNPFRQLPVNTAWLAPAVVGIATTIDVERRFDLMPALGAALSDAGCDDTSILEHCSLPNHVKGCFLVDALLGKDVGVKEANG